MPKDKAGNFHMSQQRAMAADKGMKPASKPAPMHPAGGKPPEMEDHGPSSVHEHLSAMHAETGGKHMHIHSPGDGTHTTHHVTEDGQMQGPHEHAGDEELKAHVGSTMGDEGGSDPYSEGSGAMPMHGGRC